jgi:opacity protein-like surface antigen
MKRSLLVVIILCLAVQLSDAQLWKLRRWEAQFGVGPSFSFPDIGGYTQGDNILGFKDLSYRQTRFDINGNLRYRFSRTANMRLSLTYAMLHATDVRGSNEGREYEAITSLFEPALLFEYYFVKNRYESSYLFLRGKSLWALLSSLDFYAFAGVGGANFSVNLNDALVERGITEPGSTADHGFSLVVPGGIGATLIYNPNLNFGLEFSGRWADTDYLDGFNPDILPNKARDKYYFLNFTVTYKLKTTAKGWPSLR